MRHSELRKGLIYLFGNTFPERLLRLEKYLESHTRQRAEAYIEDSLELSLKKRDCTKAAKNIT